MSFYSEEDAKADVERWRKSWRDEFGKEPDMIRHLTYNVFQISLHGQWLPLTFDINELMDGRAIERVKAHLRAVGPPGIGVWTMRRLDPNEPMMPAHVLPTLQLISYEIVGDDETQR